MWFWQINSELLYVSLIINYIFFIICAHLWDISQYLVVLRITKSHANPVIGRLSIMVNCLVSWNRFKFIKILIKFHNLTKYLFQFCFALIFMDVKVLLISLQIFYPMPVAFRICVIRTLCPFQSFTFENMLWKVFFVILYYVTNSELQSE